MIRAIALAALLSVHAASTAAQTPEEVAPPPTDEAMTARLLDDLQRLCLPVTAYRTPAEANAQAAALETAGWKPTVSGLTYWDAYWPGGYSQVDPWFGGCSFTAALSPDAARALADRLDAVLRDWKPELVGQPLDEDRGRLWTLPGDDVGAPYVNIIWTGGADVAVSGGSDRIRIMPDRP